MNEYPRYHKILFCTDFSQDSDCAFQFAFEFARKDDGLLYILHVIPGNPQEAFIERLMPRELVQGMHRAIREDVDRKYQQRYLRKPRNGIKFETVTRSGREDEEIIKFAKKEDVDLIVISTHGRTGIEHVFFGSVAEKLIRRSPFPLLIIPCRERLNGLGKVGPSGRYVGGATNADISWKEANHGKGSQTGCALEKAQAWVHGVHPGKTRGLFGAAKGMRMEHVELRGV